jgi:hypothetical protein
MVKETDIEVDSRIMRQESILAIFKNNSIKNFEIISKLERDKTSYNITNLFSSIDNQIIF